jgi:hypothetical protein
LVNDVPTSTSFPDVLSSSTLKFLLPVSGLAVPSVMLLLMVKAPLKFADGVNITPANNVFTSVNVPLAVHTPVVAFIEGSGCTE